MYAKQYKTSSGKTVSSVTEIHVALITGTFDYYVTRYIGTGRTRLVIVTQTMNIRIISQESMTFGKLPKWLQLLIRFYEGRSVLLSYKDYQDIQNYTFKNYANKRIVRGDWFDFDFLRDIVGGDYV